MCRRCSDCDGYSHHWLYNGAFGDEREENNEAAYVCKHCNALGDECGECRGDGCDPNPSDRDKCGDPDPCPECDGEGVVLVAGGDLVYAGSDPPR